MFSEPEQQLDSLRSVAFEKPMLTDEQAKEVEDWLGLGESSSSSSQRKYKFFNKKFLFDFFRSAAIAWKEKRGRRSVDKAFVHLQQES